MSCYVLLQTVMLCFVTKVNVIYCYKRPCYCYLQRSCYVLLQRSCYLLLQENDDQTIQTAQLFPVFHAQEKVGLTEILWLQGEITDDDERNILRR